MAWNKNNDYWKLRTKDGRDKVFSTPEELSNLANEYFQWCIENPLQEQVIQKRKISRDEEVIEKHDLDKMRPFTLTGLCNHLDVSLQTFLNYEKLDDFFDIVTRIRQIIETQQFEGAASGFLNPNIIARKLGLTDKSEVRIVEEQPLFPE